MVETGEMDLPMSIDEETGDIIAEIDPYDEEQKELVARLLGMDALELDVPDMGVGDLAIRDGFYGGIEADYDEAEGEDCPEFSLMAMMLTNMTDEGMLDYATDLVSGGLRILTEDGDRHPLANDENKVREDWDIDWLDVEEQGHLEDKVRYMLGQFPPDRLRPVVELAFKRAVLLLIEEAGPFVNDMMAQLAVEICASSDATEDEENPLLRP